jgi:hypothetical protein
MLSRIPNPDFYYSIPDPEFTNNKKEEMGEKFVILPDDNDNFRLSLFVHLYFVHVTLPAVTSSF